MSTEKNLPVCLENKRSCLILSLDKKAYKELSDTLNSEQEIPWRFLILKKSTRGPQLWTMTKISAIMIH